MQQSDYSYLFHCESMKKAQVLSEITFLFSSVATPDPGNTLFLSFSFC